jgi:hypothetical protein
MHCALSIDILVILSCWCILSTFLVDPSFSNKSKAKIVSDNYFIKIALFGKLVCFCTWQIVGEETYTLSTNASI